ncbi:ABC transporter ATP-binding protein [Roseobacter sp. A03A-229]
MSISVQGLTKRFGASTAVDDISFDAEENEFFTIVGASGCGKSTLLRLIAGLETPDAGEIVLDGQVVAGAGLNVAPEERYVGVVFQSYALWPHMTVLGNVAFPDQARGLDAAAAEDRARRHLGTVSLTTFADRKPENLSGGQRQRVALARCLAGDARTILMDEPLANLDPHLRGEMEQELHAFHRASGATTLYITHDQREAMALADRMAVMEAGRFLQVGTPQDIYDAPRHETVARFIGRGALVRGVCRAGEAAIAGQRFPVRAQPGQAEGDAMLFLRSSDVNVGPGGVAAELVSVKYRGGVWEAQAQIDGVDALFDVDLDQPARAGETVPLIFRSGWVMPS